jgi:lysophospholipase L1-like esterase
MRRASVYLIAISLLLLSSALLLAQAPAPSGPPPGNPPFAAGQRGAPAPANVAFHNERNDTRHQTFVDIAKKGNIDLLFVGDSITDWFYWPLRGGEATGGKVWEANFAPLKPANFAIAGDTTQGVLWRMQNGELEGFKAKLIVLMLGTNNTASNPVGQIIEGDRLIIEEFKKQQPQAKVLVLGIFLATMRAIRSKHQS